MKRILGAAAAVAVIALTSIASVGPASAATPAAAATAATPASVVSVTPAAAGDLHTGDTLRLFVTIDETQGTGILAGTASVAVDRNPVTSRTSLASWFAGTSKSGVASTAVTSVPTPVVAAGVSQSVTITVPAASLHLGNAGIYALYVTVEVSGKSVGTSRSAIAWNLTGGKAVPVTVAAPLTVPATTETFLSAKTLELDTAPGGILTIELDDVAQTQFAIGIDPRIIASIRVLGRSAPASAIAWLTRLQTLQNQTFPLAWADSDIAAGLQAGDKSVLGTKSLDYAIDPNLFQAVQNPEPSPSVTATPNPSNPTLPTAADLVSWNYTLPSMSWPVENSLTASDVAGLTESGLSGAILASTNVKAASGTLSGASGTISGLDVAVSDSVASGYLRDAVRATTRAVSNAALTKLVTTLGLISTESGSTPRPVLLTLDRDWASVSTSFDRVTGALDSHPWIGTSTLKDLVASAPTTVKIVSTPESTSRISRVRAMLAWERKEASFSTIAADPETLTSARRLALLSLLSAGWFDNAASWNTAVNAYLKNTKAIVESVQVVRSSKVLILADQSSVPVTVSNDLDQAVTVYLEVRPTTTVLTVDKGSHFVAITVDADSQRRVQVPILSLRNGDAAVTATLYDHSGNQISRVVKIQLNVQAGWDSVGTTVFAVLVVAVFAFGIIRNIRRRRRENRRAREDDADE